MVLCDSPVLRCESAFALGKGNSKLMVKFYSGTPRSGKSYHVAQDIYYKLRNGGNVISTVNIDTKKISKNGRRRIGDFVYVPIMELDIKFLYRYAQRHKKGKEGQTLLVIDECQIIFNTRDCQDKDIRKNRMEWILFFSRHGHLGYNVILISQHDRLIDRQIRAMFEYEFKHRKVNNYGLLFLLPFTYFVVIEYWYSSRLRIGNQFVRFKRSVAEIYDSYTMYDEFIAAYAEEPVADELHTEEIAEHKTAEFECSRPVTATEETGVGGTPSTTERLSAGRRILQYFMSGFTAARAK
jgi:zona occludens toxin (predicted ATPase)